MIARVQDARGAGAPSSRAAPQPCERHYSAAVKDPEGTGRQSHRLLPMFLGTTFLSALGSVMALLSATVVSSAFGDSGAQAATYTSLMLALNLITASMTTPYAPALGRRFGVRRLYAAMQAANVAIYATLAALIVAGLPGYPLLMVATPLLGAAGGISHATSPSVVKAYLAGDDLASAETRTSVASGFAWVLGAIGGAVVIDAVGPALAFAANAALTLPYVVVVAFVAPPAEPPSPIPQRHPWRTLGTSLRANPRLRRASLLGLISAALVVPLASMVVPVTRDLDHDLAIHAGLILAAISFGAILSPFPLNQLGTRMGPLRSSGWSYAVAGLVLVVLAMLAVLLTHTAQLVAIAAVAVVYGAMSSAGANLLVDSAAASAERVEQEQESLAVFFLITGLGAPIGTILWGRTIDVLSVPILFAVAGVAMAIFIVVMLVVMTRRGINAPPAIAHKEHPHRQLAPWHSRVWH